MKIFCDTPIDDARHFNFDDYVDSLQNIILYSEISTPLSIVVNGKWGCGKTSLMKTLRNRLDQRTKSERGRLVQTVWFDAWKYSDTNSMLASLISEIYNEIEKNNEWANVGVSDYLSWKYFKNHEKIDKLEIISNLANKLSGGLTPDISPFQKSLKYERELPFYESFQKYMQDILQYLFVQEKNGKYTDKNGVLVIFIDDLDRCAPKSIANVLESINLFFDQQGCIFVFGLDLHLISKAIELNYRDYGLSGEEYLKKMVQIQFNLPDLRDTDIKTYFEQELPLDDPLRPYIDLIITSSDRNPRKVKQSINSLKLMITLGNQIKGLHIEEELLIKWSILNLVASDFINAIKNDRNILFYLQAYVKRGPDTFYDWVIDNAGEYYRDHPDEAPLNRESFKNIFETFKKDDKLEKILQRGNTEFTERNISDYIYLSGVVPKDPKVTIVANKDAVIIGNSFNFFGTAIVSGDTVQLTVTGPSEEFSKGKELGRPQVSKNNTWSFLWEPGYDIEPGKYTVIVHGEEDGVTDEVAVSFELGAVTMVVEGPQSYYLGETIRLSGTCTAKKTVFLSLARKDTPSQNRKLDQLQIETINKDENTFLKIAVKEDNTWEYEWDTSKVSSDFEAGVYTIYACEGPFTKSNLERQAYKIVSISLKKPFVAATISQSQVAQGDKLSIIGTATGVPKSGIQIWIFSKDHFIQTRVNVKPDASFNFTLNSETKDLDLGMNYIIIQHPMMNNEFDVYLDTSRINVLSNLPKRGTELFSLDGPTSKKGAEAALALIDALNVVGIDDTYLRLQFIIELPSIQFNHINGRLPGENLEITANTNLAVDDKISLHIARYNPESIADIDVDGLLHQIVVPVKNDGIRNKIAAIIDTTGWSRGKYVVKASATPVAVQARELFEIL